MTAVIVNTLAVLIGSCIGMFFRKGIPERVSTRLMEGIGLCTVFIGISGTLKGENTLVLIISIVVGTIIGEILDLDGKLNCFSKKLESYFKGPQGKHSFTEGFVTSSLVFCVGAMTIVGSLQAGLTGNGEMLYTKSVLDLISSVIFASTLGIGVVCSSAFVLIFQGSIVLLSQYLSPILTNTVINEMTCIGSLLILALGINILGIKKFKIMNFIPSVFVVPLIVPIVNLIV